MSNFATIYGLKSNSTGGGASAECTRKHVIEVDSLPMENINELDVYECDGGYYHYVKEVTDILIRMDGVSVSFIDLTQQQGSAAKLYYVDNYDNISSADINASDDTTVHLYYDASRNDVFAYTEGVWASLSIMLEMVNGGAIMSETGAIADGCYYILISDGWKGLGGVEYKGEAVIE